MSATLLIVVLDPSVGLGELRDLLEDEFVVSGDSVSLTISDPDEVQAALFLVPVTDFVAEGVFEDWPTAMIPQKSASVFSFDYVDPRLMVKVVQAISGRFDSIVDTNYGVVLSAKALTREHLPENLQ
ncbi:hypothetical protein AB0F93_08195 [Micromonospora tulbaghiae]|uniref:hypothetical protein n=1 Tax=Micromonospora tulbaghiae TaxID=479978 RepID=UPI00331F0FB2